MDRFRNVTPLVCLGLWLGLTGCQSAGQRLAAINPRRQSEQSITTGLSIGRLQERQGEYQAAEKIYRELHEQQPGHPAPVHRLAVVQMKLNRPEQAERYFELAAKLAPNDPELLTDMGYACHLQGRHDEAEKHYRQALELAPASKRARSNLALTLGMRGQTTEAYALYREMHTESEAHANIAYIHAQRGEGRQAIQHYSKSLDLKPGSHVAAQGLTQLAEMRNQVLPAAPRSSQPNIMHASTTPPVGPARPAVQTTPAAAPLPVWAVTEPAPAVTSGQPAAVPAPAPVAQPVEPALAWPGLLPLRKAESVGASVVEIPTAPTPRVSRVTPISGELPLAPVPPLSRVTPITVETPETLPDLTPQKLPLPEPTACTPVDALIPVSWEHSGNFSIIVTP